MRSLIPTAAMIQGASRGLGLGFVRALLDRGEAVVATCRAPGRAAQLAALQSEHGPRLLIVRLDVEDHASIAAAAETVRSRVERLHLLINAAGVLHDGALTPEKRLDHLEPDRLARLFAVNAIGPALVARHFRRLLLGGHRAVLANISARVGSIGDNRIGGWYGYRASKAAQNQLTRTIAIELGRQSKGAIVLALHPGTIATDLSAPYTRRTPPERLFPVERAVEQLLAIIDRATPEDSGRFIAWDGTSIEW